MLSLINRRSVNKSTITMKKFFPILLLLMAGSAVHAGGLSTRHQSSLQFINDGGYTDYTRMGASYSVSGTNATTSHTVGNADPVVGGLGVQSYAGTGVATPGTITAAQGGTNGSGSFSFSQSFTQADIAGTDSTHTDFGNVTVHTGGSTGTAIPGTITSGHATEIKGVNLAGSSITAQFVSEITAF